MKAIIGNVAATLLASFVAALVLCLAPAHPAGAKTLEPFRRTVGKQEAATTPRLVKVGIYVEDIYNIDVAGSTFEAVFWAWFLYDDPSYDPLTSVQVVGAQKVERSYQELWEQGAAGYRRYAAIKYVAKFKKEYDLTDFPFDRHHFEIVLEDAKYDDTELRFEADVKESGYGPPMVEEPWKAYDFSISDGVNQYPTSFGLGDLTRAAYPSVLVSVDVDRCQGRMLFNLLFPAYIAVILAAMGLRKPPEMMSARTNMMVAAIILSIGNKYALDLRVPLVNYPTLVDRVMWTVFTAISLCFFMNIVTANQVFKDNTNRISELCRKTSWAVLVGFTVVNIALILLAVRW